MSDTLRKAIYNSEFEDTTISSRVPSSKSWAYTDSADMRTESTEATRIKIDDWV